MLDHRKEYIVCDVLSKWRDKQINYELVKDKYECIYRGEVAAKNKGMMRMYFVEKKQ